MTLGFASVIYYCLIYYLSGQLHYRDIERKVNKYANGMILSHLLTCIILSNIIHSANHANARYMY